MLGLVYIAISGGVLDEEWKWDSSAFKGIGSNKVINDFMQREGILLIFFGGGYVLMRKYNDFLDQVEADMIDEENRKKKAAKLLKSAGNNLDAVEEDEEESSEAEESENEQSELDKK